MALFSFQQRSSSPSTPQAPASAPDSATAASLRTFARFAAASTIVLSLLVLARARIGVERLDALLPGSRFATPNAALINLLAGLALMAMVPAPLPRARRALARLSAAAGTLYAGLVSAEYVFRWDIGIDRIFDQLQSTPIARFPGRPSPQTAAALLLLSLALLLIDSRARPVRRFASLLALTICGVAVVVLFGIMFAAEEFYGRVGSLPYTIMAPLNAFLLLLLSAGLLAARPDEGPMPILFSGDIGGVASRRLLLGLLVYGLVALVLGAGPQWGWYSGPVAVALVAFGALLEGVGVIFLTGRRLDELSRARRLSEEQCHALVENASDGVFTADGDGRFIAVNALGARMAGFSREELIGRAIADLIPAEDVQRMWRLREQLAGGGMQVGEWTLRRKDGTLLPIEVSSRILPDGRWLAFARDISERRRAEAEIRRLREMREQERFKIALESAATGMVMVDRKGVIVLVNGEAERIFGYSEAELRGRLVDTLVPLRYREGHPALREGFFKGAANSRRMGRDLVALRSDGAEIPVEIGLTRIAGENETFVVASVTDISDRKKAEAALRRTLEDLESFAYTISHNLRGPLRAIQGYAHTVAARIGDRVDAETRDMLERIDAASVRLDRLIRDVLSYSAITRRPFVAERVSLDETVAHVIAVSSDLQGASVNVRGALGCAMGQPSLLIQVVANLLGNAAKFVPGERAPVIEVWTEAAGEKNLRLIVADNGQGIPAEQLDRIFKPFERLETSVGKEGTGIGLAIVQRAVERMGGRVGVESRPGEGSRFWVELPRG